MRRSVFLGLIFEDMRPALGGSFPQDLCTVVCSRHAENTLPSHEHAAGEWCGAGPEEEEEEVEEAHMGNSSPAEGRLVL